MTVSEKIKAIAALINAMAECIQTAGSIPSGHLYAAMMSHGCSLQNYEYLLRILVDSGRVIKRGDMLTWKA